MLCLASNMVNMLPLLSAELKAIWLLISEQSSLVFASLCLMPLALSYLLLFIFDLFEAAIYSSSEGLPTPPAFAMNNHLPSEINFPMRRHQPTDISVEEYPERPGEPECSFFIKTGDCKYRSNCKFHHPKSRMFRGKPNSFTLSDKGLPLRPVSFSYYSPSYTRI